MSALIIGMNYTIAVEFMESFHVMQAIQGKKHSIGVGMEVGL